MAASKALLENKRKVLMLDVGTRFPERQQLLADSMAQQPPSEWSPVRSADPLQKRKFNSAYMYETPELPVVLKDAQASASFARGGLSTIWGASVLPYESSDMQGWPELDLAPYYEKVLSFVPLAGKKDALAERFPLYAEPAVLQPGPQALAVLENCARHDSDLRENGMLVGQSRLAVRTAPKREKSGCVYCGLCMSGCPHDLIYSAAQTLDELRRDDNFSYQPGVIVNRVQEDSASPVIHATRNGEKISFSAEKVFLACGVYSTARILLESKGRDELVIKDSQYIIIPCLAKKRGQPGQQHALSQVFIELLDEELGNVHLQLYSFSDLIEQSVASKLGFLYKLLKPLLRPLIERLMVVQGFLHSDVSGSLVARRMDSGLSLEGSKSEGDDKRLARVLLRHSSRLGLFPLLPLVEYGLPGQGFHSGGSFPMSEDPGETESDVLGRPGYENIHVVDSTVLPGIAGTTITLTEMANAYRIADLVSRDTP